MRSGEIFTRQRTDNHYLELADSLDDLESRIKLGEFPVNRHECGRCIYQKVCDQTTAGIVYPKIEDLQLKLFDVKKRKKERTGQKHFRFIKDKSNIG